MEDGKTRWEVGTEQMGEKFEPWSICTDQSNCVYVADCEQDKVHLFSAVDGAVIKTFDVGRYCGIYNIIAVRFYDQHLYVEHKNENKREYVILKFKQIKAM